MERIKDFLDEQLGQIILSNSRRKEEVSKVRVRPLLLQEKLVFQVEEFRGKQAFHQNLMKDEAYEYLPSDGTGISEGLSPDPGQQEWKNDSESEKEPSGEGSGKDPGPFYIVRSQQEEEVRAGRGKADTVFTGFRSYDGRWQDRAFPL